MDSSIRVGCGSSLDRTRLQSHEGIFPAYQSGPESAVEGRAQRTPYHASFPGIRENYRESLLRIELLTDKQSEKSFSFPALATPASITRAQSEQGILNAGSGKRFALNRERTGGAETGCRKAMSDLSGLIIDTTAATLAGLLVKMRVVAHWHLVDHCSPAGVVEPFDECETPDRAMIEFTAELERLLSGCRNGRMRRVAATGRA
jgi:hypothetical protein